VTVRAGLRGALICLLPVLVGLHVGATALGGSSLPWRPTMVDLDVYRQAGRLLVHGGDVYNLPGQLPFLYPPFAALLAVPLAVLPTALVQVGWTVANALALLAVLFRFGLRGWGLSLVGAAALASVEPVSQTLGFGQLGIFLVALVLLDLAPGPRVLGARRLLPEGVLTGLATAIKLTPGIFLLYLLAVGKIRSAVVLITTLVAVTLLSAAVVPDESLNFWGRLAHGDTGLGHGIVYYTNQSVMADCVRIFGLSRGAAVAGLALSAAVAAAGVWAAAVWHRQGRVRLAVSLCGVAGLLASPVSWLHHFVWVVPLALCLLEGILVPPEGRLPETQQTGEPRGASLLPGWSRGTTPLVSSAPLSVRFLGSVFIVWVLVTPFQRLPNGADVELTFNAWQNALESTTAALGIALLVASIVTGGRAGLRTSPTCG